MRNVGVGHRRIDGEGVRRQTERPAGKNGRRRRIADLLVEMPGCLLDLFPVAFRVRGRQASGFVDGGCGRRIHERGDLPENGEELRFERVYRAKKVRYEPGKGNSPGKEPPPERTERPAPPRVDALAFG
jgi:hypothetical protein